MATILNSNPNTSITSGPVSFKINDVAYQNKMQKITNLKQVVMPQIFNYFKDLTPVRSGNAKNSTTLDSNLRIQAQYQYAGVLDAGRGFRDGRMRGSIQAPDGMSKLTKVEADRLVKQYINTFGRK